MVWIAVDHNLKTLIILTKMASVAMPWPTTPIQSWWPLGLPVWPLSIPWSSGHQQDGLETGDPVVAASFRFSLQRAGRTGHVSDGILAGLCFALVSVLLVLWLLRDCLASSGSSGGFSKGPPWRHAFRWTSAAAITALIGSFFPCTY